MDGELRESDKKKMSDWPIFSFFKKPESTNITMEEGADLMGMVMAFRVTELQALLGFAGKNKQGRKNELQARALELVKNKTPQVVQKMKELYRNIQVSNYASPLSLTGSSSASHANNTMAGSNVGSNPRYASGYYDYGQNNAYGSHLGHARVLMDGQYRNLPLCPDIKLKELPFFDIMAVLIRPSSLISQGSLPKQEIQQSFCLTPSQANDIANSREFFPGDSMKGEPKVQYTVQVQLRFCALNPDPNQSSAEEQEDLFPQGLIVRVNGRNIPLPHPIPSNRPGVEAKRPSKPLNITNSVRMSPTTTNAISVQWTADNQRNYAMSVNIVKRLTAADLFQRLKKKNISPAEYTRGRIKEITTAEEEDLCAPTSIRVSVACPLGKNRMSNPCRSTKCKHLQCFDANLFLLMNEKKPTFVCPVCNKPLKFNDLTIDGYFLDVISKLSINSGNDIELYADGSWQPAVKVKNEVEDVGPPPKRIKSDKDDSSKNLNQTIDLDDDICIVEEETPERSTAQRSNPPAAAEPEVIDLIDSSDEEDDDTTRGSVSHSNNAQQSADETSSTRRNSVATEAMEDAETDDEDYSVRRPRRKASKVNYIEESSSDSSTADEFGNTSGKSKSKSAQPAAAARAESPPFVVELSDSPPSSPEGPTRAFAAVSNQSSSNNNRTGSGSTMYSSSATATTTEIAPITTGIGHHSNTTLPIVATSHSLNPQMSSFTLSTSSSVSSSLNSGHITPSPSTMPTASSLAGYSSYNTGTGWDGLNFINVQQQLGYGSMGLSPYDYFTNTPTQTHSQNNYPYGPGGPRGGGPGGGYGGWM